MDEKDVIIVGLGPTGAALAGLLGQRGVSVAVFDRLADLYPLPRAIGLDHEVMRIVQELSLADRLAPHIAPYRPSAYRGTKGQLIRRLDSAPPPFHLGWAPNYVFEQPAFERLLRARLEELPNVVVHLSADVERVGQDDDGAWADVRLAGDTETQRIRSRYLIACDGGASLVRKKLGLVLEDLGFDEPGLVVDVGVDDDKLAQLPQTQVQYCEPERPCTYVVCVDNHRRWEIRLNADDRASGEWPEEDLWPLLRRWIGPQDGRIWRSATYRFHGLVAREWRRGRILLAGDAAHMTPPFMAQGMAQGMRDALNLAWKLERVIRHGAPEDLLDTYQQERKPHVTATTRAAMTLGELICERDPERAAQRDARLLDEQGGAVQTMLRQDLIPGLTSGLIKTGSPEAGSSLPQPFVHSGRFAGRLDDISGATVRAVAVEPLRPDERAALIGALTPVCGVLVELGEGGVAEKPLVKAIDDDTVISAWLGTSGQRIAIVRPDHYVYGTASSAAEAVTLLLDLRTWLIGPDAADRSN
ncbi:bifunctional 3-(3-hydroxy-phenyl)propionate/3-hydroxycinnamic acid hydroxylase [Modestobacter lapidis]|nr:bifunctional 3-(3-hydroxy-phenyl)propionate/3-hydroxycinnamic acid hydroxylase [Modestobacter lapidis]